MIMLILLLVLFLAPAAPALGSAQVTDVPIVIDVTREGAPESTAQATVIYRLMDPALPLVGDASATFTLATDAPPYRVDVPPYRCRRLVGGTSVLWIATVAGGAETVLKSVSVPNPAKKSPFTIRCVVASAAVTLSLNGVLKLKVAVAP